MTGLERRLTSRCRGILIRASEPCSRERILAKPPDRVGSLPRPGAGTPSGGKPVERRLAAIMAADVVGYSRLMGADEVGTLRQLTAHRRELLDPSIAGHRGRIVKTTGDGVLA